MTTIVGGICPRCGQFHDLFLAVDGSIVCRNADGASERIRQLEAERDAARAEVAALRELNWATIAAEQKILLDRLRIKVEGLQRTAGVDFDGPWTALQEVLALIEEVSNG